MIRFYLSLIKKDVKKVRERFAKENLHVWWEGDDEIIFEDEEELFVTEILAQMKIGYRE